MSKPVNVTRPTADSKPFKALVVNALSHTMDAQCRHCGRHIMPCGFDCAFSGFVHVDDKHREGSHKCGRLSDQSVTLDASP